ncbi:HK97-gp10 family putative phage morphogenesis protein [Staphylococcus auricularis]|uniref:PhiSLT protein n=1 Tax=Staphylococcus auricularis TaxID=29379 RepID=A0ABX5IEH2_9STAP|nr:HK97-gp10 family putative phage morphogenesis protein [Staphylococcus auricularis]PTH16529.1 hypothetical protein BU607_08370 [Staphylococcus auricularis]
MSVEIEGVEVLLGKLNQKYGDSNVNKATDRALNKGAKYYESQIKKNFEVFEDTGATIDEIKRSNPYVVHKNIKEVAIHWQGKMNRYAIIHLNEWGTVKNPNPRGKGQLLKTEREARKPYLNIVREEIKKQL